MHNSGANDISNSKKCLTYKYESISFVFNTDVNTLTTRRAYNTGIEDTNIEESLRRTGQLV